MDPGSIAAIALGCIFILLIIVAVIVWIFKTHPDIKASAYSALLSATKPHESILFNWWIVIIPVFLIIILITYIILGIVYTQKYRSTPGSIAKLLTIRQHDLSTAIDPLAHNSLSVCDQLYTKANIYAKIAHNKTSLVNWRPLTVRLVGYLGGISSARDGVFDMEKGVSLALSQGARAFVFDIDYLDNAPCAPVVIHRDDMGIMRSLHTGSIQLACKSLADKAFKANYDPVLVILYLRRIPDNTTQRTRYLSAIAASLDPLSPNHLGSNEHGNFHNARSESQIFTSPITNYQKKFIVMTNYNTNTLTATPNPKDNLDFWTNVRIYQDPSGTSSTLGSVTPTVPTGQMAFAQVGAVSQLLNIGSTDQEKYTNDGSSPSMNTFKICLGAVDYTYKTTELNTLMNILGIQCVPMDVVALSALAAHINTIKKHKDPVSLDNLANPSNPDDPLSFWIHAGWSRKLIIGDDVEAKSVTKPIQGFIPITPIVPTAPSPRTNSNGGLVNIA